MLIRLAQERDTERIGEMWQQLVDYHQRLDDAMPHAAEDGAARYAARIASLLGDAHSRTYVAEVNEQVVGYATGMIVDMRPDMFEEEITGMIADIFVDAAHRGTGVGTALVRAMEGFFSSRGIRRYEWFVARANEEGHAFWRRLGGRDVVIRMRNTIASNDSEA